MKRLLIRLKRFRYRCGYGVHSPFAFDFITNVIYEKLPYYAYQEIEQATKGDGKDRCDSLPKVNRLLFRLVNRTQPDILINAGESDKTALYLQSARKKARYISVTDAMDWASLGKTEHVFLHINTPDKPEHVEALLREGVCQVGQKSVFVIQGIYRSPAMKALWERTMADENVGITFDLYDLGILFFDKSKIKQHYTVNF